MGLLRRNRRLRELVLLRPDADFSRRERRALITAALAHPTDDEARALCEQAPSGSALGAEYPKAMKRHRRQVIANFLANE